MLRDGKVETLVGIGLFDSGADDGDRRTARLQHPLGVAALSDGSIAIADTFNSLVRIWADGVLRTLPLSEPVDEPGGLDVLPDGRLLVADTNHHRVVTVDTVSGSVTEVRVREQHADRQTDGPSLAGVAGALITVRADVDLAGSDLDLQQGPPVRVHLSTDSETLLGPGPRSWALDTLPVSIEVRLGRPGTGVLTLDVIASTCEGDVCTIRRNTVDHPLTVS